MKQIAGIIVLAVAFLAPALVAQEEHGEVGVYADYTRLHHANNANFWGPAASLGFNVNKWVQLEGNFGYAPTRTVTFTGVSTTGGVTTTNATTSSLRLLEGWFGPKFQTGAGPVKAFFFLKGGFLNFNVSNRGGTAGFTSAVNNVTTGDTNGVFYPGGGVEFGMRHGLGIRAEIGDMMYFDNGANHNFKLTVGPTLRW